MSGMDRRCDRCEAWELGICHFDPAPVMRDGDQWCLQFRPREEKKPPATPNVCKRCGMEWGKHANHPMSICQQAMHKELRDISDDGSRGGELAKRVGDWLHRYRK